MGTAPDSGVGQMRDLGRRHLGDDDYCEPVGLAAVALMEAGDDAALELAEFGLGTSHVDLRVELTNKLLAAAQRGPAAESVGEHLTGRAVAGLPALCLALALRGAGWDLAGLHMAEPDRAGMDEEACARLALRAMDNDEEAAAALAETLRRGQPRQRYCAAHYLALARVRSAALIFSSVRDQVEAPYVLRVLCAASLLRRGHPSGLAALNKLGEGAVGRIEAELLTHVCRAIEDTIPVMLQCRDVNVGRFV